MRFELSITSSTTRATCTEVAQWPVGFQESCQQSMRQAIAPLTNVLKATERLIEESAKPVKQLELMARRFKEADPLEGEPQLRTAMADLAQPVPVEIPGWLGFVVHVNPLVGAKRDRYEELSVKRVGQSYEHDFTDIHGRLLSFALCDENGNRLFTESDARIFSQCSARTIFPICRVASRISGIKKGNPERGVILKAKRSLHNDEAEAPFWLRVLRIRIGLGEDESSFERTARKQEAFWIVVNQPAWRKSDQPLVYIKWAVCEEARRILRDRELAEKSKNPGLQDIPREPEAYANIETDIGPLLQFASKTLGEQDRALLDLLSSDQNYDTDQLSRALNINRNALYLRKFRLKKKISSLL